MHLNIDYQFIPREPNQPMKRLLAMFPSFGILLFLGIYFYAASLYPGGTRLDPTTFGYSQINNY